MHCIRNESQDLAQYQGDRIKQLWSYQETEIIQGYLESVYYISQSFGATLSSLLQ